MIGTLFRRTETLLALTIVILGIYIGSVSPVFLTVGNLFDLLRSSIVMGLFAMGTLIVIISGGIDVSFTALAVFAQYSTVKLMTLYMPEAPLWIIFTVASLIGLGLGMINAEHVSGLSALCHWQQDHPRDSAQYASLCPHLTL